MRKTTVYLPDALKRRLAQAAHRRGQPEAAPIRAATERLLEEETRPRPTLPLLRSGDPTLADPAAHTGRAPLPVDAAALG
jgi:hypothetical protein